MRKNAIRLLTVCFQEATKMRSSYFNGEVFSAEEGVPTVGMSATKTPGVTCCGQFRSMTQRNLI